MSNNSLRARISLPYAEALFDASYSMNIVDNISQDLEIISDTILNSESLRNFLFNPLVLAKSKKKVVIDIFKNRISSYLINFLFILIDRRRIDLLDLIKNNYLKLLYQSNLTSIVEVYTAVVINDIQKQDLVKKLQLMTGSRYIKLSIEIKS